VLEGGPIIKLKVHKWEGGKKKSCWGKKRGPKKEVSQFPKRNCSWKKIRLRGGRRKNF